MNNDFQTRVIEWATARNIIGGATARDQFLKLVEEVGEAAESILASDHEGVKDGIGDAVVVVVIIGGQCDIQLCLPGIRPLWSSNPAASLLSRMGKLSKALQKDRMHEAMFQLVDMIGILKMVASYRGLDFDDCCEHAWNEIKDRKGVLVDGVFVKEAGR